MIIKGKTSLFWRLLKQSWYIIFFIAFLCILLVTAFRIYFYLWLRTLGSRIDKQWFMIRDTTLKTDRLLTIVPLMGSTAYGCDVPNADADVTRNALVDLFTALQHPLVIHLNLLPSCGAVILPAESIHSFWLFQFFHFAITTIGKKCVIYKYFRNQVYLSSARSGFCVRRYCYIKYRV